MYLVYDVCRIYQSSVQKYPYTKLWAVYSRTNLKVLWLAKSSNEVKLFTNIHGDLWLFQYKLREIIKLKFNLAGSKITLVETLFVLIFCGQVSALSIILGPII